MSKNYCAEQFEDAYLARRNNYFGPLKDVPDHAKAKKVPTRFIANDRGHLSEAQGRKSGKNPFGHFHGTWDNPCHHPGNHCSNTVSRSAMGVEYLRKNKTLYDAKIRELESKHDTASEKEKIMMAGIQ